MASIQNLFRNSFGAYDFNPSNFCEKVFKPRVLTFKDHLGALQRNLIPNPFSYNFNFRISKYKCNSDFRYARHRWSYSYVTYYCMWFRLFATALVPLAALTYFNAKILIYYRDNNFTRAHTVMRRMRCNNESDQNRPQEIRLQLQNTRMTNGQIGQNGLNGQNGI